MTETAPGAASATPIFDMLVAETGLRWPESGLADAPEDAERIREGRPDQ
ncbi:hypothetical protein [Amycolatopsis australiensis]|uniref:Uncharacterized protein n=1 Tax=Amycolatopsis australiensis TaxID=546364 RepID=A0A1K1SMT9_9PSEU|nr:hypothetical protein [Amycolatopsis australiensis]SFW85610.1 hypothetical protein SAMN04489730_6183 [Amycolatopsis australiensis]